MPDDVPFETLRSVSKRFGSGRLEALLFDMDGTLSDTDAVHRQAMVDTFAARGVILSDEDFHRHVSGQSNDSILGHFFPGLSGEARRRLADEKEAGRLLRSRAHLHLTPIEYRLLTHLTAQPDRVVTHQQLLKAVWGPGHAEDTHYVRVHMANLRKKVEDDASMPRHLLTEAGVGALFLGSQSTEFSLKDNQQQLQGQVRQTGVFLRENGTTGTLQQIDLAV